MKYVFRGVLALVVLGLVAVVVYGYIGDLTPKQEEIRIPVTLSEK